MRKRLITALILTAFVAAVIAAPHSALACNNGPNGNGVAVSTAFGVKGDPTTGADANCIGGTIGSEYSNPVIALIGFVIGYASAVIGLIMVLMIVIAGLQYVLSGTAPEAAKAAKDRLKNAITGFILFLLMYGILNLILPANPFAG